jgi:hypothetical protein
LASQQKGQQQQQTTHTTTTKMATPMMMPTNLARLKRREKNIRIKMAVLFQQLFMSNDGTGLFILFQRLYF